MTELSSGTKVWNTVLEGRNLNCALSLAASSPAKRFHLQCWPQGWAWTACSQGKQRGILPTHTCRVSRFLLVPLNRPPAASLLNQEAKEFLAPFQSPGSSAASPGWIQWGLVPTLLAASLHVTAYLRHPPEDCPFWTSVLSTCQKGQVRILRNVGNVGLVNSDFLTGNVNLPRFSQGPQRLQWRH